MKAHDLLLEWISARGSVRSAQVKNAVLDLGRRAGFEARPRQSETKFARWLQRLYFWPIAKLGHVERWRHNRWSIARPALVLHGGRHRARGFVIGARSPRLWRELAAANNIDVAAEERNDGPSVWRLSGLEHDLRSVAERVGLVVSDQPGLRILRALPPLATVLGRTEPETIPPDAGTIECFASSQAPTRTRRWIRVRETTSLGCYRVKGRGPVRFYRRIEGGTFRLRNRDDRLAALWAEIKSKFELELRYIGEQRIFEVPNVVALPQLVERSLVWASGHSADTDPRGRFLRFESVDLQRAQEVARILDLELLMKP